MKLKPYVSVHTSEVDKKQLEYLKKLNDYTLTENFGRFIEETTLEKVKNLQLTGKTDTPKQKKEKEAKPEVKQDSQ